jgi:hypothetical protein
MKIIKVENDQKPISNVAFTFRFTNLTIYCDNLPSTIVPLIRISNDFLNLQIESKYIYSIQNSLIQFMAPNFDYYNLKSNFSFPLSLKLGVSYTGGSEYVETDITYDKKILDVVFFAISPNVIHREATNLTATGIGFTVVKKCQYRKLNDELILETDSILSGTELICPIPVINNENEIKINLLNTFDELSSSLSVYLFDKPTISDINPKIGKSIGNSILNVYGSFPPATFYCRFGVTPCTDACSWINSGNIQCNSKYHLF